MLVSNTPLHFQGKLGKGHPALIWLKLKHGSQAKRNQHLSQHVQESKDSNTGYFQNTKGYVL